MSYQRRDYYWKRVGWFWELWTECAGAHFALSDLGFWRWRTAAKVTNLIFAAYHEGRDAERAAKQEVIEAERRLSDAYLRLRTLIPGALKTPHAPSPEQVWSTTEAALRAALTSHDRGGHDV